MAYIVKASQIHQQMMESQPKALSDFVLTTKLLLHFLSMYLMLFSPRVELALSELSSGVVQCCHFALSCHVYL